MSEWRRVTRQRPCPVCGKADWCGIADDESAAVCMRVESDKLTANGGWLHKLRDSDDRRRPRVRRASVPLECAPDFTALAARYERHARRYEVERFAASLGVSAKALRRLRVGHDGEAFTFPMRDAGRRVVGIRRRLPNGRKLSVTGGREGLLIPDGIADGAPVIVCEGPTDTAALLTLEFDAIGRPSCSGGVALLEAYCKRRPVTILADADEVGRVGALILCERLKLVCPVVRVIQPPDGLKDARQWLIAGATRADVLHEITGARPRPVKVGSR